MFSCGDPAGIGPRAVVLALRAPGLRAACRPLLLGHRAVWRRAGWTSDLAELAEPGGRAVAPPWGKPSARGGRLSFSALELALRLLGRGMADGLVTAPISKKSWALAGVPDRDHTGWLSRETGRDVQMILGAPRRRLWTVLATRHVPLSRVSALLTTPLVSGAALSLRRALAELGFARPRLGLCAFNPHAGEDGLLGVEESRVLLSAVRRAKAAGTRLEGPIAADTAWRWHREGRLDGLVSLYHDQALIPLKIAAGLAIVNWTEGLPFPRTSPGHGTGFDLAGRGEPDAAATLEAALLAARLARRARR
ncbi:MAG: 4-hydroxythreonine-4-phosphate dehydrogenase PdxA [Elusimicrobia bacterium]|nr:4-hydroxythreonine-4-phosphate dehydrogenase PdxA [Elusimicrobiota bacterium]MDE2236366.1 4-hydroxythreonine-4-phosphate dehydrogenase PdxA [Elusimicrobiota bacterium]MDE2426166.1 4-hydroxythreonine-4-phosphate dehydrogenase PdxA [Elusimicrobiota bacterium]